MPIPVRETFPTDRDDLQVLVTDDGSRTLIRTGSADAFHSGCGAKTETQTVYLENSGIATRLRNGQASSVLEVGLGTGMAMLMTLDAALQHDAPLDYLALEIDWLPSQTLSFLHACQWVERPWIVESYLAFRQSFPEQPAAGDYTWELDPRRHVVVRVGDARASLSQPTTQVNAVYFDPFCPESAPECWQPAVFQSLRRWIDDHGTLTTYSCSRVVRDALHAADWQVSRVPGPQGGKREVLVANPN